MKREPAMVAAPAPGDAERPMLILVEDDDSVRRALQLMLSGSGYRVRAFASAASALADAVSREAEYLVADFMLSASDGVQLLASLRASGWSGHALLVTAYPSNDLRRTAEAAGYAAVMEKPVRQQELLSALARAHPA
jgi:FixJ family two-component response regulator